MQNLVSRVPPPKNEPVSEFRSKSKETAELKVQLADLMGTQVDVPMVIGGKEVRNGKTSPITIPHRHSHQLGVCHSAGPDEIAASVAACRKAAPEWARTSVADRAAIFLRAAELLATKYRPILNAATMLGQSKTCYQAEIDAACELIDFWRFNTYFQQQIYEVQPNSAPGVWNQLEYRPLEGFVFAVTPFNFTSIGGNLPTAPALMGNVAIWKPATTATYSGYFIMKLLEEAGLPPGVIQYLPGSGSEIGNYVFSQPDLAGVHFTGSTGVFQGMWKTVGENIGKYKTYPRLVGETGGKDFVFAHPSADAEALATALVRGAFEYQGQKCSAASRAYIPKSLWGKVKEKMVADLKTIAVGDVVDFRNFMSAVIDKKSFDNISSYINHAKQSKECTVVFGGGCDDKTGYFIQPTVIETTNPKYKSLCEEIFGPVLTVYVYDDNALADTLKLVDETSPYALTGAIFGRDRAAVAEARARLVNSAGNLYINNKPTGAVVGQQPFGGARASGTNDKAGSLLNLLRWVSPRTVSETFVPPTSYRYPFLEE